MTFYPSPRAKRECAGTGGLRKVGRAAHWFYVGRSNGRATEQGVRQSSLMAAALARFIVARSGQPLIDDGTTQAIVNHLHAAIAEVDLAWSKITGKPTTLTGYGITDAVNVEEKGQPEGVATLDDQGYVPTEQLP